MYLIENNKTPYIVRNEAKLLRVKLGRFVFIDSANFIPVQLEKLPKKFGVQSTMEKGYFLYLFNTDENLYYKGKWPEKRFYTHETFSKEETIDIAT